jgi:hypothetical protein
MPERGWTTILFVLPHVVRMTDMHQHAQILLVEKRFLEHFCPGNLIYLISTSQVARIPGMSHQTQPSYGIFCFASLAQQNVSIDIHPVFFSSLSLFL